MLRHLTLIGTASRGELLWDDERGAFQGTDANLVEQVADGVPWHPHFPIVTEPARKNAQSLIVLLYILGWDCPAELSDDLDELLKDSEPVPPGAIG